ncbi:hypothetical protein XENOCAPTIV_006916 [Xenoophorus captivus]|uniref:Uncharacterized protein n=1 Tax=Xenoophorus captivus TaxID=1517983 RepID=A0ABV0R4H3_9TELE
MCVCVYDRAGGGLKGERVDCEDSGDTWGPSKGTQQNLWCSISEQHSGLKSSRVICAAWRICPTSAFVFSAPSSMLYSDTHHQESRSRMKGECGRKEKTQE